MKTATAIAALVLFIGVPEIRILFAALPVAGVLIYFAALWWHRARQIRAARRVVRQYIAAAVKGDRFAAEQVSRASYYLRSYNL